MWCLGKGGKKGGGGGESERGGAGVKGGVRGAKRTRKSKKQLNFQTCHISESCVVVRVASRERHVQHMLAGRRSLRHQ